MKPESTPCRPRHPVRLARLLLLAGLLVAPACSFFADEFTWLDRRAPHTLRDPDGPVAASAILP
ncbi:MAG: hypothetical protein FJ265_03420 [Planctomycetes bacterium]|nr:hypothetical protein [Planctomycetota bacterium]